MKSKPKYHLIAISKIIVEIGSIFNLDLKDRVICLLSQKGIIVAERTRK